MWYRIRRSALTVLLLLLAVYSYAQRQDLIVTLEGDSIACRIDSITNSQIFFSRIIQDDWTQTYLDREEVADYRKTVITSKGTRSETGAQWYSDSCGLIDIDNCSPEEFNCMWKTATETVNKGIRRTVLGVAGLTASFLLLRGAMGMEFGGPGIAVLTIGSGIAGLIGIFSGPANLSMGSKQKSQLKTSPHYKSMNLGHLDIAPAIHKNQFNNSYAFGLTATLAF